MNRHEFLMTCGLLLGAGATFAGEAPNLLVNAEFAGDNLGGVLGWDVRQPNADAVTRFPGEGPDGATAIRLELAAGRRFEQGGIRLVEGERYRLSVAVRTRGLGEGAVRFFVRNAWWAGQLGPLVTLPSDTHGEWVTLSDEALSPKPSKQPEMYCMLFLDKPLPADAVLEIAAPRLTALSEKGIAGSSNANAPTAFRPRLVPIDPLLSRLDAADARIEFYFGGDLDRAPDAYDLVAAVDGRERTRAPFDVRRRATAVLGPVEPGPHALRAAVVERTSGRTVAADEYPVEALVLRKLPQGRRLNNFVSELYRGSAEAGCFRFVNPRNGWVWLQLTPADGGPVVERFLNLPVGEQAYEVPAAGELRIHAIKPVPLGSDGIRLATTDYALYQYGRDFFDTKVRPFFTELFAWSAFTTVKPDMRAWLDRRGVGLIEEVTFYSPQRTSLEKARACSVELPAYRAGMDLALDESEVRMPRSEFLNMSEAIWSGVGNTNAISVWWSGPDKKAFADSRCQASLISSVVNSGRGRGKLLAEAYICPYRDFNETLAEEDNYLRFAASAAEMVPAAREGTVFCFSGYVSPEGANYHPACEPDMKFLYDHFIRRLATEPGLKGVGGLAATAFHHADEELMRWLAKCIRYYAIEGGTEPLAPRFGYSYLPGIVRNPDFAEGLSGWTAEPAEPGSIADFTLKGYGRRVQYRTHVPEGYGDRVAKFVRSAKGPNRLVQTLTGVVPGRTYSLSWCTADLADVNDPGSVAKESLLRAELAGAKTVDGLGFDRVWPADRDEKGIRHYYKKDDTSKWPLTWTHRLVFTAEEPVVTLTFTDWASETAPGATVGRVQLLNYIICRPYFDEKQ